MDATLKGIVGILGKADPETRCAALVVLTQLGVADDKVVSEVRKALQAKNSVVRDFALAYFETVRPRQGVSDILPFLDSDETPLRDRAVALLAQYGPSAISATRKHAAEGPRRRLNATIDLCARVRSSSALDFLFDIMAGDDFEANRAACDALLVAVGNADDKGKADVFARTEHLAAAAKAARPALVAAAKLYATLGEPKARKRLFGMLAHADHAVVTHALGALLQCLRGQKLVASEVDVLLALLVSDDEQGVLRPVVRLLEGQSLDRAYLPQLNKLAESPQPIVKRFAVQKLGAFEGGSVVKTLIGYLTDDSFARRDQATTSLKQLGAARLPLMKEFLDCDDERRAWTLGEILLAHDRAWKRDVSSALWKKLEQSLEKRDDRLHTAYFHFLNTLDPESVGTSVRERAEHLRKAKKFPLCVKWLHLLRDSPALDAEAKFTLSVAELKSHSHSLSPTVRRHDPALELLRELAASTFPTAERLKKERSLEPEELFYIAFNFAEGTLHERDLASELLENLVAKTPRTKIGKAAKNKLALLVRRG